VKVIIETGLLTDEEKALATRLSCEAGAHFVKTCTGVSVGAATVEDIKLMKANLSGDVKLKASAGIRTYGDAIALIEAGADRLGTSAGISIVSGTSDGTAGGY
jgi:deoxyribose-phosphate aldolase